MNSNSKKYCNRDPNITAMFRPSKKGELSISFRIYLKAHYDRDPNIKAVRVQRRPFATALLCSPFGAGGGGGGVLNPKP